MNTQQTICLVDGSGYIFRAFYALPPMTRHSDGTPVNAVYGFFNMLTQLIDTNRCSHIVVVFDAKRKNFRNDIFPEYKATRKETPPELIPQFPLIRAVCTALNVPYLEMEGYEADDLIATYARLAVENGFKARVISADKDLMQLMRDNVSLYDPMKKKELTNEDVLKKFGVTPDKVVDVQALMGDSTDNVPGASGIGPKTAAELINQFNSVENLYQHLDEIKSTKRKEGLERDKEKVFISKQLVLLNEYAPVQPDLEQFKAKPVQTQIVMDFLIQNEFKSLLPKMQHWCAKYGSDSTSEDKSVCEISCTKQPDETEKVLFQTPENCLSSESDTVFSGIISEKSPAFYSESSKDSASNTLKSMVNKDKEYTIIKTQSEFNTLIQRIQKTKKCAILLYPCDNDKPNSPSDGLAIAVDEKNAFYVPLTHAEAEKPLDLFSFQNTESNGISRSVALNYVQNWLSDKSVLTIGCDLKSLCHQLSKQGMKNICLNNFHDIMLESYVLNGSNVTHTLSDMRLHYLNDCSINISALLGSGKNKVRFETIELETKAPVCMQEVSATMQIHNLLAVQMQNSTAEIIYHTLDLPLIPILFEMEKTGILIDKNHLSHLRELFTQELDHLMNQIYELAGEVFNINSPAQVSHILFDKLELSAGKKTASGTYATDVKTLTALAEDGNLIAQKILEYRLYGKLKSTYIDALTAQADENNRVHTTFLQTITNTGRLSSVDPNLQNIPIRTSAGKEIRKSFIAKRGYKLVCADYSQIELRLMADVANVAQLKESFLKNEDIHARTASQIFGQPLHLVDADLRRRAKAINFGLIYGISGFGLARQLGIGQKEAKEYINTYFEHYPEIKTYMDNMTEQVLTNGYVKTHMGRKCFIQGYNVPKTKSFAVRAGINAPIQGGAADIIKRAMIDVDKALKKSNLDARLLLQVHDELVFEVKENDVPQAMELIKQTMENATRLSIPLIAEVQSGDNWKEAH